MAAITLNSTTFYPSDVQETFEKIGVVFEAANGNRRFLHRANKRSWNISFQSVPLATVVALRTIAALTSTFTFTDENSNSFTVFCDTGALKTNVAILAKQSGSQVLYYNADLQLLET